MRKALSMDLFTCSPLVPLRLVFRMGWYRPGLPLLCNLAGPVQHFKAAILDAGRGVDLCSREDFWCGPLLDIFGSSQLLNSAHVRERDKALRGV